MYISLHLKKDDNFSKYTNASWTCEAVDLGHGLTYAAQATFRGLLSLLHTNRWYRCVLFQSLLE